MTKFQETNLHFQCKVGQEVSFIAACLDPRKSFFNRCHQSEKTKNKLCSK